MVLGRRSRAGALVLAVVLALAATSLPSSSASAAHRPSEHQWRTDVRTAMAGSGAYLSRRAAQGHPPGRQLAVNLDIDNTMLATAYDHGSPVLRVLRFARTARSLGMAVLVNTGRDRTQRARTLRELRRAGYRVDALCMRRPGGGVAAGKQACRASFRRAGYVLTANVGNNTTDFVGGGYERAFRLPSYGVLA